MPHTEHSNTADWTKRPIFRRKQLLTADRLNRICDNQASRLRRTLLGLAGPGVVHGFNISTNSEGMCDIQQGAIYVGCGLALDCWGRQLYWTGGWVHISQLAGKKPEHVGCYRFRVHYAERRERGEDHCGCGDDEADWIREGVVFSLCYEGCEECEDCEVGDPCPHVCHDCLTPNDYVCGRLGSDCTGVAPDKHLANICEEPDRLCAVGCDEMLYDPGAAVDLARLGVCRSGQSEGACESEFAFCPDEPKICSCRSYVYRNPLLYELIRGCHIDLARVADVSFRDLSTSSWECPVLWDVFKCLIKNGLIVQFTKPIQKITLHDASVFVTAVVRDQSFFRDVLRIPVESMEFLDEDTSNQTATGVRLWISRQWVANQLESDLSCFHFGAIVEFTIRGSLLRDLCGSLLDARPLDIEPRKPGQAMPGGEFIQAICVAPKPTGCAQPGDYDTPGTETQSYEQDGTRYE